MTQAVILAGGKGTRLAERLFGRPKPLVEVDGAPLLERQIRALTAQSVDEVLVLVNHEAEQIRSFLRARDFGCRIRVIDDGDPRGTAGAVLAILDQLEERAFVVYGDTLFNIDLAAMSAAHAESGADATLLIHPNDHPADSDLVEIDDDGTISAFHPYPHPAGSDLHNLVNAAFYIVERRALEPWRDAAAPLDFAKDLFPAMLARRARLRGYVSFEYIKDLGTPKRLDKVEHHLRSGLVSRAGRSVPQAAVFLDRDGTLNELRGYVCKPEQLHLLSGAGEAVRRFNDAEFRTVLITNQPVIARGDCTPAELNRIHAKLGARLGEAGAFLDATYHCPHHPDGGFPGEVAELKIRCDCRKPGVALFQRAIGDLNISPARSWMVGDSTADMAAAETLGLGSVLVHTGEGGADGKYAVDPDFSVADIGEAAHLITGLYPSIAAQAKSLIAGLAPGTLLLVGGPARCGKTTLASVVRRELRRAGHRCERLSLDRWILPESARREGVLGRFDMVAASRALEPWLAGGAATFVAPVYDRFSRTRLPGSTVSIDPDVVLVLEGVPALLIAWMTARSVVRVNVEAEASIRRNRVIADLLLRGSIDTTDAQRIYEARERDEVAFVMAAGARADHRMNFRTDGASG